MEPPCDGAVSRDYNALGIESIFISYMNQTLFSILLIFSCFARAAAAVVIVVVGIVVLAGRGVGFIVVVLLTAVAKNADMFCRGRWVIMCTATVVRICDGPGFRLYATPRICIVQLLIRLPTPGALAQLLQFPVPSPYGFLLRQVHLRVRVGCLLRVSLRPTLAALTPVNSSILTQLLSGFYRQCHRRWGGSRPYGVCVDHCLGSLFEHHVLTTSEPPLFHHYNAKFQQWTQTACDDKIAACIECVVVRGAVHRF